MKLKQKLKELSGKAKDGVKTLVSEVEEVLVAKLNVITELAKEQPKYSNTENDCIRYKVKGEEDPRILFKSRSCAVCIVVKNKGKVLLGQRSEKMNHPLAWCLPCGYLDHDEDVYEAASRELFEEMGIYVEPDHFRKVGFYEVMSDPKRDALQNVTFHFEINLDMPFKDIEITLQEGEVNDYAWVPKEMVENFELAFGHGDRIINRLEA